MVVAVVTMERRRGSKLRVVGCGVEVAIVNEGIIVVAHHNVGVAEAGKGRSSEWKGERDFERYYGVSQKGSIDTLEAL